MQPLERAVAIFCIVCICAELTAQLAGSTWARRCIKAVAGLYILVVFARTVPQAHVQLRAFLVPVQEPVSIASPETAILAQTAGAAGTDTRGTVVHVKPGEKLR